MNCIDGIEGVLKCILTEFQARYETGLWDDADFIPNLRLMIDGAARFLEQNEEIGTSPDIFRAVLYQACRSWWVERSLRAKAQEAGDGQDDASPDEKEYLDYYFDYLYQHGTYPD